MTTYTNEFFDIPANDTRFNLVAAVDAYEWVMGHPDEARFVVSKALFDLVPQDIEYHQPVIDAAVNSFVSKRIEDAKRGISRSFISKSENGEDVTSAGSAVMVIDAISKAYDTNARQANVRLQTRGAGGQWTVMNRRAPRPDRLQTEIPQRYANSNDIPRTSMTGEQSRRFQNDYMEIGQMLRDVWDNEPGNGTNIDVIAHHQDGRVRRMPLPQAFLEHEDVMVNSNGIVREGDYFAGHNPVTSIEAVNTAPSTSGPAFDVMSGLTNQKFADHAIGTAQWYSQNAAGINEGLHTPGVDDFRTNDQFWRRMGTASQIAAQVGGPYLPPVATFALQAGRWVGDLAPEAEKVIGPAARRSAYRYRGTERKPSEVWQHSINSLRAKHEGKDKGGRLAHKEMLMGDDPGTPDYKPSATITAMNALLPDPQRYHLNRKAGVIPP